LIEDKESVKHTQTHSAGLRNTHMQCNVRETDDRGGQTDRERVGKRAVNLP